jgi:tetratricopeptide (TPR) repeat protein
MTSRFACSRVLASILLSLLATAARPAWAQVKQQPVVMGVQPVVGSRSYPPPEYFAGFPLLADGEYTPALKLFRRELEGAYHFGQSRWIDSICAYTMVGESLYRIGDYRDALENFENALRLYNQYSNWMLRVQFPAGLGPAPLPRPAPWGKSTRGSHPARFPDNFQIAMGMSNADVLNTLHTGGPVVPAQLLSVNANEIVRCTCLAMQRRKQILGPLVVHDSLTDEVLGQTAKRQGPPNHWSEAWLDVQQGIAYSAAGKTGQAIQLLQRSLTMGQGQFDHPLTGIALLELGNLSMDSGDYKAAAGYYEEATYTGYDYSDYSVIEEGFRNLFLSHIASGDPQVLDTALIQAAAWARNLHELRASVLLSAAESAAIREQTQAAIGFLKEAGGTGGIGRRTMANCEIGARYNYLTALTQYQLGAIPAGDTSIGTALNWEKEGSKRLFQLGLADTNSTNGRFPPRVAMTLYQQLLNVPSANDWLLRPLESLALLSTPHPLPFEHWFEIVRQQSQSQEIAADATLEVADQARRQRFLVSQPLGGRLMSLRWVLEAPAESLTKEVLLQRQELLTRYPKYAEAATKARKLQADLAQLGLKQETREAQRTVANKLSELATLSTTQENMLHELALRREAADVAFPRLRTTKEMQHALSPDQLLLAFFNTSHASYGWLYSMDRSVLWKIDNSDQIQKRTAALLKTLGNVDATRDLQDTVVTDESWKAAARDLSDSLRSFKEPFKADFKEMVIVPDGVIWYVPFEALPFGDAKENRPLISRMRIRYAPMMALAVPAREGRKTSPMLGVVVGKLYPSDTPEIAQAALEQIQHVAPHAEAVRTPLPAASPVVGSVMDGLVVLDDIPAKEGPLEWSPIPFEKAKTVGTLAAWLTLPWKNPDQIILPGFHTPAENSLRTAGANPGNDLFLTSMGLMATGARTILLSRWRTGGQTAIDLVREFVQELPFSPADEAWQRAVQLVSQSPLDPAREPRLKRKADAAPVNAQHPFFWAGYMLIDSGVKPQKTDEANNPLLIKFDMQKPRGKADEKKPEPKPADQPFGNDAAMGEKPANDRVPDQPVPVTNPTALDGGAGKSK